jgi:hypothetical protein
MRSPVLALLALLASGCASRLADAPNDALVGDLVKIRPFDGHTGFGTPEGPRSYGWEAKEILVERGHVGVPALASALADPKLDATQRRIVRLTIGDIGGLAWSAVPALVAELSTADAQNAANICAVLARIGPSAAPAVPDLLRLLRSRGDEVCSRGATVGDLVVPPAKLRGTIAYTLGRIGPHADAALPALAEGASQTADPEFRRACRQAMRTILGVGATARD